MTLFNVFIKNNDTLKRLLVATEHHNNITTTNLQKALNLNETESNLTIVDMREGNQEEQAKWYTYTKDDLNFMGGDLSSGLDVVAYDAIMNSNSPSGVSYKSYMNVQEKEEKDSKLELDEMLQNSSYTPYTQEDTDEEETDEDKASMTREKLIEAGADVNLVDTLVDIFKEYLGSFKEKPYNRYTKDRKETENLD